MALQTARHPTKSAERSTVIFGKNILDTIEAMAIETARTISGSTESAFKEAGLNTLVVGANISGGLPNRRKLV